MRLTNKMHGFSAEHPARPPAARIGRAQPGVAFSIVLIPAVRGNLLPGLLLFPSLHRLA
jgi:hypothetical protein